MSDFKCESCGEECQNTLQFIGHIICDNDHIEYYDNGVCPVCLSVWFIEAPEDIKIINMKRVEA